MATFDASFLFWVRNVSCILVPKCLRHFGTGATLRQRDTSAPAKKFETLRHQTHGAEMSWVRSVLGPKCPYTNSSHGELVTVNA